MRGSDAKPVVYLDVDGVLWDIKPDAPRIAGPEVWAKGADGVEEFIAWTLEHCEVRWITTWAMGGDMWPDTRERLAMHTGVPAETWAKVRPSLGWTEHKSECIDFEEHRAGRPFAWIEDGITSREMQVLRGNGFQDAYIHTDVFEDPLALRKALAELKRRFQL